MEASRSAGRTDPEELSLTELLRVLWSRRWHIAVLCLATGLIAGSAVWLLPRKYDAVIVVSPVSENSSSGRLGGVSSLVSQFGGLASLAGLSVTGDSKRAESVAVLQSQFLTQRYIKDNHLLPVLYADKWDAAKAGWKSSDPKLAPTLWQASEYFKKNIRKVNSDTKTGLVTLTITWKDPRAAAKWANDLARETNEYLRNKAIAESERNIAYLNQEAAKTEVVAVKQAIYEILQNEISRAMLARGSDEYAFRVIDPAVPSEKPSSPGVPLAAFVGVLCGLALSIASAFVRVAWAAAP